MNIKDQSPLKGRIHYNSPSPSQSIRPFTTLYACKIIITIIIGIQPLGRFGQRPELSQVPGTALVRCILGKFLGVVCHCFPPVLEYISKITLELVTDRWHDKVQ